MRSRKGAEQLEDFTRDVGSSAAPGTSPDHGPLSRGDTCPRATLHLENVDGGISMRVHEWSRLCTWTPTPHSPTAPTTDGRTSPADSPGRLEGRSSM